MSERSALSELLSIEQIKQLKAQYFQAVDEKNYGSIVDIFTEDAVVDFSGEVSHRIGHQGVTIDANPADWCSIGGLETGKVIAESVQDFVTVHHGHDPQIQLTGTHSARGRWAMQDIIEFPGETMTGYGSYSEEYRLADGCWRISRLRLDRLRVTWKSH